MPKVNAFTNAVGDHFRHEFRVEESIGTKFNVDTRLMEPFHQIDDSYAQLVAESHKPPPFQGDHHTAYDYSRTGGNVTMDSPYLLHSHYDNPVDHLSNNYDYVSNQFISKRHGPFNYNPVNSGAMDQVWSESVTKALNSLKGKDTSDLGTDLGELKQTVDMFSKNAMRGANFIRHMRRGNWKKAADDLGLSSRAFRESRGKNLANMWLEYSYGWAPYASSMYGLGETIAEAVSRQSNLIEGNGKSKLSGTEEFVYGNWDVTAAWEYSVKTVLRADITNPMLHFLDSMGLTNPASVAWELVPFSFVVDWFIPVGNVLSALTSSSGLTWHGGQITERTTTNVQITHKTGYITPWVDCINGGDYRESSFRFRRVALTGFPYPRFYADMTPLWTPKGKFRTARALNALALVRQLT
jgi:hypothetical protein